MAARTILSLALVAVICSLASGANKCYRCGYQKMGDGPPTALPGMPECGDQATLQDNQVDCTGDDCCGSIREWLEMVDNDTGEKKELLIGRHDCEQDLEGYAKYDVLCSDHTDECVDVDLDSLPQGHNETMLRAKICFCSGPLCNFHVPGLETTLEPEPTQPTAAGKQCYNCGYRKLPNGEVEKLPDTAECNDFATPDDITVNCPNDDDCCGSMKESFTKIDETTNETSTVIIGRHGCESDLNYVGEQTVLCSDHTDSCFNIDKASLPDHNDNNVTVTDIEICFCSGDRCNAEDPIFPETTTVVPETSPTQTTTTMDFPCPIGWMDAGPLGCFQFHTNMTVGSWFEANLLCEDLGGFLMEPKSEDVQTFFASLLTMLPEVAGTSDWWIGLTDIGHEGSWLWIHNVEFAEEQFWAPSFPDREPGNDADCAMMSHEDGYLWHDTYCEGFQEIGVICQL